MSALLLPALFIFFITLLFAYVLKRKSMKIDEVEKRVQFPTYALRVFVVVVSMYDGAKRRIATA